MKLAVVDYGIGNLRSAEKAFEAVGVDALLTGDHATLTAADAVVPQMQWNELAPTVAKTSLLELSGRAPWVYFVHSFAPPVGIETVATCSYGGTVAAMAQRDRVVGMQFHPEKSGPIGLALLKNFVDAAQGALSWN